MQGKRSGDKKMKHETNSGADAPESKKRDPVVFTTILREDRDWINETKGKLNREERLHEVIKGYKELYVDVSELANVDSTDAKAQ